MSTLLATMELQRTVHSHHGSEEGPSPISPEPLRLDIGDSQQSDPPTATTAIPQSARKAEWRARFTSFVVANFLPLAFLLATVVSLAYPVPGKAVAGWHVGSIAIAQAINNCMVFLVSGLTLRTTEFQDTLRRWVGVVYGLLAILLITCCLGFATVRIGFTPREFAAGLTIFCVVPTTLGVGVALTAAAGGNQALALFLTIATNLLGIVTVPYELRIVLAGASAVTVEPGSLVLKLLLTVLVPTVVGKLLRSFSKRVRSFVANHKVGLSIFSHVNLALIIWQNLSGARDDLVKQKLTSILIIIAASILVHLIYLVFNGVVVVALRLPVSEAIAVLIMSSQKSAPVAVTVISYITTDTRQRGLLSVPAIIGQLTQIFMGSVLVRYLKALVPPEAED